MPFLSPRQPGRDKSRSQNSCQPLLPTAERGFLLERPEQRESLGRRPTSARLCGWLTERDGCDKGKHFQDTSCKHTEGLRDKPHPPRNCTEQRGGQLRRGKMELQQDGGEQEGWGCAVQDFRSAPALIQQPWLHLSRN